MPDIKNNKDNSHNGSPKVECDWAKTLLSVSNQISELRLQIECVYEFLEEKDSNSTFLNGCEKKTAEMEAELYAIEEELFDETDSKLNYEDYHDMIFGADQKVDAWTKEAKKILRALKSYDNISAVQAMHRKSAEKPALKAKPKAEKGNKPKLAEGNMAAYIFAEPSLKEDRRKIK